MPAVYAVAVSSNTGGVSSHFPGNKGAGKTIQKAMAYAVDTSYRLGITDPEEIGKRMQAARKEAVRRLLG